MSVEMTDFDSIGDSLKLADWALQTQVWNGRQVSWNEASEFREEVQSRILDLLFQNSSSSAFEQMAAPFAWIGSIDANRALLAKDIQALDFSPNGRIVEVGFGKTCSKFWKKHKKEILIGAIVVAVITVVIVVAISTSGTGAGGAAAAGGAVLDRLDKDDSNPGIRKNKTSHIDTRNDLPEPPAKEPPTITNPLSPIPFDSSMTQGKLIFGEEGVLCDGRYSSYTRILQSMNDSLLSNQLFSNSFKGSDSIPAKSSWLSEILESVNKSNHPDFIAPAIPLPNREATSRFSTIGRKEPHLRIAGVNGINTSWDEAYAHANYLSKFVPNQSVDWVYNRSHGAIIDLAEVFTLNYLGFSPNTGQLLKENWTAFHEENKDRPHAKYLQFCHSQGAIHVRNALIKTPEEIRDRVIVVAIAPAAVVSRELCFHSVNYACKNDIVTYGELAFAGAIDSNECGTSKLMERIFQDRKQLIFLEPDPDTTESVHYFQNPTYMGVIKGNIAEYLNHNGEYQ